ncbi:unnamed protein product [Echinostoma caproni]|uniref:Uncharacterized protein n=1 Tax=Echinostoma caproni TaxID=27848 RepID=A0A3P8B7T1_9TREM|nr:unnamed protein product [Echinostoma caproni]
MEGQHQSPAHAAQRTTSTPVSGSATSTLSPTEQSRNEEGPEPTPVRWMILPAAARKDRADDVPTQLETGKELRYNIQHTIVELPGSHSTVGTTSSQV